MKANKIRLINAEELPIKEWRKTAHLFADDIVCAVGTDYQTNVAEAENRELHRILHAIEQAPTIDPKSLRPKGQWKFDYSGPYRRCRAYCTACGKRSGIGGIKSNQIKPYCPNCGARMEGT